MQIANSFPTRAEKFYDNGIKQNRRRNWNDYELGTFEQGILKKTIVRATTSLNRFKSIKKIYL